MEKQKIFWVILSVTVFVVVVLVVGVFLLKKDPTAVAASPTPPSSSAGAGIYEFGRDAAAAEGDTEVLRFVIGGDGTTTDGTATTDADGAAAYGTEPPATAADSAAAAGSAAAAKPAAVAAKPAASATAKPATATPSATPAAKPSAATVTFWIQTGSYKSQTRAEELSQALAAKGLAGRVFSFSQADATWFRVRIGPYANKQEAEKFLSIVRKIQGLEASFISQVSGSRSAN